jgi:hypothetical protein
METKGISPEVQEIYDELADEMDGDEQDKLIEQTSYDLHQVDSKAHFYQGSIKITDTFAKKARILISQRFKATQEYTAARIDRINKNWQMYESELVKDDSLTKLFYPELYNSCEDWIDDFTLIFSNFVNYIEVTDVSNSVDQFIARSLKIDSNDMPNQVQSMFMGILQQHFGSANTDRNTTFYFKKADLVRDFLKWGVEMSGFDEESEGFLIDGTVSGQFLTKDEYRHKCRSYSIQYEETDDATKSHYLQQEQPSFLFKPIDPRKVIFPRSKNPQWIAEELDVTITEILSDSMDENGKQLPGSRYDLARVKKVMAYMKDRRGIEDTDSDNVETEISGEPQEGLNENETESKYLDGDLKIYETHWIPMILPGSKKPVKTRMYCVNLGTQADPNIFVVGIEKSPHIVGFPYHSTPFKKRKDEWCGSGLPEVLEPLQDIINQVNNHVTDMMLMGLYGIMVLDPDAIENEADFNTIRPRMILKLKNARGRSVNDIVSWMHPPLDTIQFGDVYLQRIIEQMKRTSRKGPTGERVSPTITATEMMSIIEELKKSVNRAALRLNIHLTKWAERMYMYYMLNWKKSLNYKATAYRIWGTDEDKLAEEMRQSKPNVQDKYVKSEKAIKIDPKELLINGLKFKCDAVESFQREAVEKQQTMQAVDLVYRIGAIQDQQTGQQKIFTDENGGQYVLSEYKILKRALKVLNMDNVFISAGSAQGSEMIATFPPVQPGQPDSRLKPPALTAKPTPQAIQKSATTLNPGA